MKKYALRKKIFLSSKKGILVIGTLSCALSLPVHAATFGHARLDNTSAAGLDVRIPINDLTTADAAVLAASAAPAKQWQANGLTPPVDLNSLRFNIQTTNKSGSSILQVTSDQAYKDTIIDLLLNVTTASGIEPYQVSLIVPPSKKINQIQQTASSQQTSKDAVGVLPASAAKSILVKPGDNMFAIAKRNAVDGVSVYQLMMALQRTNQQAFINNNVNLVKAGSNLTMPSIQEMLSISDAQARRDFIAHTNALSGKAGDQLSNPSETDNTTTANSGVISSSEPVSVVTSNESIDRVKLGSATASDTQVAEQHALADAKIRVGQLEENVKNLNQALQAQGKAASDIVTEGAKVISDSINQLSDSVYGTKSDTTNGAVAGSDGSDQTGINIDATGVKLAASSESALGSETASDSTSTTGAQSNTGLSSATTAGSSLDTSGSSTESNNVTNSSASGSAASQSDAESSWLNWVKEHTMGAMSALLAILVLIIVWVLRRLNTRRDKKLEPVITDTMVQEKLNDIDLNLDSDIKDKQ